MNKNIHGDCLEVMKDIPDGSIDAIITDPPYGINYQTIRTKSRKLINDDNLLWVEDFTCNCARILKHEKHLYCFVDPENCGEFIINFKKNGFKIRNLLTIPRGVKGNGGERIFQQQFEFCIFATLGKKNEGRKFNKTNILKPSEQYIKDKRYKAKEWLYRLPDNWRWTTASVHNAKNNKIHPTQKNVNCVVDMINISTNEGETVLDPFAGSGTTAIACLNTNRNYICIEQDETYFNQSLERIKNHVVQEVML